MQKRQDWKLFPSHAGGGDSGNKLVVIAEGLHLEQLGDHGHSLVGEQHLLRIVRQPQPGRGLVVSEVLHPLQELLLPREHKEEREVVNGIAQ